MKRLQKEKDEFYKMLKKRDDEISTPPLHHPVIKNLDKSAFTATLSADLQVINGDIVVFDTVSFQISFFYKGLYTPNKSELIISIEW